MNIYLIEDNSTKARQLPLFVDQMQNQKSIALNVPAEWKNPREAIQNPERINNALNDPQAIILLDYDMNGYEDAAEGLMRMHPEVVDVYRDWQDRFDGVIGSELASAVLAVASQTGVRVLICSTVQRELPNPVLNAIMRYQPTPITWPTTEEPFSWPDDDLNTVAQIAESHWRSDYNKATGLWTEFGNKMKTLFPATGEVHHAYWHIQNKLDESSEVAKKALEETAESWNHAQPAPCLKETLKCATKEEIIYFAKTACNDDSIPITVLCNILDLEYPEGFENCKAITLGVSPGAILLAFLRLKESKAHHAEKSAWKINLKNKRLRMFTAFNEEDQAFRAKKSLEMTPMQQLSTGRPPPPGMATLAMDYLSKLAPRMNVEGTCLALEFAIALEEVT